MHGSYFVYTCFVNKGRTAVERIWYITTTFVCCYSINAQNFANICSDTPSFWFFLTQEYFQASSHTSDLSKVTLSRADGWVFKCVYWVYNISRIGNIVMVCCKSDKQGGATPGRIISALSMYFTVCIPHREPCHVFQYFDCMRRLYLHNAKLKSN